MKTREGEEIPASAAAKVTFRGEGTETHLDSGMRPPENISGPRSAKAQEVVEAAAAPEPPPETPLE